VGPTRLTSVCCCLQVTFIACAMLLVIVGLSYFFTRAKPVYLLNYAVHQAPD